VGREPADVIEHVNRRVAVRAMWAALALAAILAAGCGSSGNAGGEWTLDDAAGDVAAAAGPDIVAVTVERDDETIVFQGRFAEEPPLKISAEDGWIDMILIGTDVPPIGPSPATPGGEWPGLDYALGTHGPSATGMLVRLTAAAEGDAATSERREDIAIETDGTTLSFPVPRDELGDPATLAISIAAARESNDPAAEPEGAEPDVAPDTGTWTIEFDA
jgi:hypothetical protein